MEHSNRSRRLMHDVAPADESLDILWERLQTQIDLTRIRRLADKPIDTSILIWL